MTKFIQKKLNYILTPGTLEASGLEIYLEAEGASLRFGDALPRAMAVQPVQVLVRASLHVRH